LGCGHSRNHKFGETLLTDVEMSVHGIEGGATALDLSLGWGGMGLGIRGATGEIQLRGGL